MSVIALAASGCGNKQQDADQQMRKSFESKGVSLKDVPPEQRGRVEAYMKQYSNSAPAAK